MDKVLSVSISVCTAFRPTMLARCLKHLTTQKFDNDIKLYISVIDNEHLPNNKEVTDSFPNVKYIHEPRRGIPFARNAGLRYGISVGADWIGYLDDDTWPEQNWLCLMLHAARQFEADVVTGKTIFIFPNPRPFWIIGKEDNRSNGHILTRAATRNIVFKSWLANESGANLFFDESIGLGAGSDTDYFSRANSKGAKIIFAEEPVIYEEVIQSRSTLSHISSRYYKHAYTEIRLRIKNNGYKHTLFRSLPNVLVNFPLGIIRLSISPLMILFGLHCFKKSTLKSIKKIMHSLARVAVLMGKKDLFYLKVDGY